ncbi:uncharacterized protein LOC128882644 [Hylaeus volcanicus]|uniref:uncharacterized protein LOC128882644 n=1 Tax=Hylaeus volcanicus TaxID=313075 RepID=UPI0023B86874|nr:uncharacterized protein LOC128882644 [Hylaeus volcanicus]
MLGNAFYLVVESTPFFSELIFSSGLSTITGLNFFSESLLSEKQIQCLVNLFNIITTHKCYNVAQNEWRPILKIFSFLNALINTDTSWLLNKKLKEEKNFSTVEKQKTSDNPSSANTLANWDHSDSQRITECVTSSAIVKKRDLGNTSALSYASESLKSVLGLGKTPREENRKKNSDIIEPNSEEIVTPEMYTFQINHEHLSEVLSDAQIDCLFVHSVNFSSICIEEFVYQLCDVAMEELKLTKPRMFCLQKIVEVADYNVNRIGIVKKKFWTILVNFFSNITNEISFSEKIEIGLYTIDSLRQLFLKVLDQNSCEFNEFQEEFLKPYLLLMQCTTVTKDMKFFIIEVLTRIVQTRAHQLKSGWRTILHTLEAIPTVEGKDMALCNEAFNLLLTLLKTNFADILLKNMKEVLNTFSVYNRHCHHLCSLNTNKGVTISYKVLEYLEWLAIMFSGETYTNYCHYVKVTPDEDIRTFELDVFHTIAKRMKETSDTNDFTESSCLNKPHATKTGHVQFLNLSSDTNQSNVQVFIKKLFELHCLRLAQTSVTLTSTPNHPYFEITQFEVGMEHSDDLLVKSQQHHNPYLFSTLSCISRLATISVPEHLDLYENALETLFRLLNYFAHVFQYGDMWKMCIRGILFPYVDDLLLCLQHYKLSSTNQLKEAALVGVDNDIPSTKISSNLLLEVEYDINNALERSLPYKLYILCLQHVFDLFKRQFHFVTKCLPDVFSLLNTCVRGSHPENVSKFALIIFGKIVDETASFCTEHEWNCIAVAFENFFSNVATQELQKPSDYSLLVDPLISPLPSNHKFNNNVHVVSSIKSEEKTNLKSLNSSDPINVSSPIIQFVPDEIIRNCVTRLSLIDLLSTLVQSHVSSMDYSCIERFVLLLISAFEFARDFNSHINWRHYLKVKRIFQNSNQLPGLLKQECEALKNSFVILFTFLNNSDVDHSQIKQASTQLLSLLENVVIDVVKKCQSFQAPIMDPTFESTISSIDYYKIYCSETEQEVAFITNILLSVVFDSLRNLPTYILEMNAKRLFVCLLYLIPYASQILRNSVVMILLDCILPCLKGDSNFSSDTELISLVSSLKILCGENKVSSMEVSMIPPPPPPSAL